MVDGVVVASVLVKLIPTDDRLCVGADRSTVPALQLAGIGISWIGLQELPLGFGDGLADDRAATDKVLQGNILIEFRSHDLDPERFTKLRIDRIENWGWRLHLGDDETAMPAPELALIRRLVAGAKPKQSMLVNQVVRFVSNHQAFCV